MGLDLTGCPTWFYGLPREEQTLVLGLLQVEEEERAEAAARAAAARRRRLLQAV